MKVFVKGSSARAAAACTLVLAASALLIACASVLGFERLEPGEPDAGASFDTGTDSGADTGVDASDPSCSMLGLPDPAPSDPQVGTPTSYVLAISGLDVGIPPDAGKAVAAGLNLDLRCTNKPNEGSCASTANNEELKDYVLDKPGGVDNAGFNVLKQVGGAYPALNPENIQLNLRSGLFGMTIQVLDYNGSANDDTVIVAIHPALGVLPSPGTTAPKFNKTDTWVRDVRFSVPGRPDLPQLTDARAYVANRRLVAKFKRLVLPIAVVGSPQPLDVELSEAYLTGALRMNGEDAFLDDGLLAGRWPLALALGAVGELRAFVNNGEPQVPLCTSEKIFKDLVAARLCPAADLTLNSSLPETASCAAVSAGIRFTATPANLATFARNAQRDPNLPEAGCPPASCP